MSKVDWANALLIWTMVKISPTFGYRLPKYHLNDLSPGPALEA